MSKCFISMFLLAVLIPCLGNFQSNEPNYGLFPKERAKHAECAKKCMEGKCGKKVAEQVNYSASSYLFHYSIRDACFDIVCTVYFDDCSKFGTEDGENIAREAFFAYRKKTYKVEARHMFQADCEKYCSISANRAPKQNQEDCVTDCGAYYTYP